VDSGQLVGRGGDSGTVGPKRWSGFPWYNMYDCRKSAAF